MFRLLINRFFDLVESNRQRSHERRMMRTHKRDRVVGAVATVAALGLHRGRKSGDKR